MEETSSLNTVKQENRVTHRPHQRPGKRPKIKKRWFILLGIAIIVMVFIISGKSAISAALKNVALSETTVLALSDVESSISATGTVESKDSSNVYSTLNYTVKAVNVEVGDKVNKGDVMCLLDSESLEKQIAIKETAMGMSASAASQQVKAAKDNYSAAKTALEEGKNAALINAQSALKNSLDAWEKAKKSLAEFQSALGVGENSQLLSLDAAYNNAQTNLDAANDKQKALDAASAVVTAKKTVLDAAQKAYDAVTPQPPAADSAEEKALKAATAEYNAASASYEKLGGDQGLAAAKRSLEAATTAFNNAASQRNAGYRAAGGTLEDYRRNVDNAYEAYNTAQRSYDAAVYSAKNQLESYENQLASSKLSSKNDVAVLELSQLQDNLNDCSVKAPVSGTVTAAYATVGAQSAGLLFVIENTQALEIKTTVKEYDIGRVKPGMSVTIKSDATGDEVYDGVIGRIAPTSKKSSSGVTVTGSDVLFDTIVNVVSNNTGLKIGMNVRLDYILEHQKDVLTVPFDATYENAEGKTCVLLVEDFKDGRSVLVEAPVTLGIEGEIAVAVMGDKIVAGARVLNDGSKRNPGEIITLVDSVALTKSKLPPMMQMMQGK